jgi:hypothetical protein
VGQGAPSASGSSHQPVNQHQCISKPCPSTALHFVQFPASLHPAPFAALLPRLWPLLCITCCWFGPVVLNHYHIPSSWLVPATSLLRSLVAAIYASLLLPNMCLKLPQLLLQLLLLLLQLSLFRFLCCSLRLLKLLCHILLLLQSFDKTLCCRLALRHCCRRVRLQAKRSAADTLSAVLVALVIYTAHQL